MQTNSSDGFVKPEKEKLKENGFLEGPVKATENECPHAQCPSPKKGLAHAIVQCNIHLGRIADPRILPCGHSFCYRCLRALSEEQNPVATQNTRRSPSAGLKLICPLCRRENHLESIESLTTNYAITDLLEIFDAEEKEEERIRRETLSEMEHTIGILKSLREQAAQEMKTRTYGEAHSGFLGDLIIASEKKSSYLGHLAQEIEEERDRAKKERLIRNLHYTCLAYQRLAEMSSGELALSNGTSGRSLCLEEMEQFLRMYKNIFDLEYRPTQTMTERRSRVWFTIILSLLIQQCWTALEERRFADVARLLSLEFSSMFDDVDGVWIAVVGRRPLGCWIWKDEHDYACLDMADCRLVIYRRSLIVTGKHNRADCKKLQQSHLDKILTEAVHLKEQNGWKDLNMAKFVRERLQKEFDGFYWHTAAGYKGQFAVFASAKAKDVELEVWASQIGQWNALVWEG